MQAPERDRILVQLAAARSALDAAIGLLAGPQIEMPTGYQPKPYEGPCKHPMDRRHMSTYGDHWTCMDCGHSE